MPPIFVIGTTGKVRRHVVAELLDRQARVRALARHQLAGVRDTAVDTLCQLRRDTGKSHPASAVRQSIFGAVAVAHRLDSSALLASGRIAFLHGLDRALLVSSLLASVGIVLAAVAFLPRTSATQASEQTPAGNASEAITAR